jgi:hypothetical protein
MNHRDHFEVRADRSRLSKGIELYVLQHQAGKSSLARSLNMEELQEGMWAPSPTLRLHEGDAQALMDELWRCGLRPSEGTGSAGSLAATERHLEDMRKLALHWCLRDELGRAEA